MRYIRMKCGGLPLEIAYDEKNKDWEAFLINDEDEDNINISRWTDDLYLMHGYKYKSYISLTDMIEDELRDRDMPIGE